MEARLLPPKRAAEGPTRSSPVANRPLAPHLTGAHERALGAARIAPVRFSAGLDE